MMKNTTKRVHHRSMPSAVDSGNGRFGTETADQGRRQFLKLGGAGLALASASPFLVESAWAGRTGRITNNEPAILDPADPQARALSYTAHSSKAGQSCGNCQLYTGSEGEEVGPCAIFSYRVSPAGLQLMVQATGWCRSWGPRQPV